MTSTFELHKGQHPGWRSDEDRPAWLGDDDKLAAYFRHSWRTAGQYLVCMLDWENFDCSEPITVLRFYSDHWAIPALEAGKRPQVPGSQRPESWIDWGAPLEAYHPDGRVKPIPERDVIPYDDGTYGIITDCVGSRNVFKSDGTHHLNDWRIRNRIPRTEQPEQAWSEGLTPELVERMLEQFLSVHQELERINHTRSTEFGMIGKLIVKNRAIMAEIDPPQVDPLVEVLETAFGSIDGGEPDATDASVLREVLAKHGLQITEIAA